MGTDLVQGEQESVDLGAQTHDALLNLAKEGWRFARTFARLMTRLDVVEQKRLVGQFNYYVKQLEENLGRANYKLVNLEGHPFDPGLAATPINLADFSSEDTLVVDQMLEPLIMTTDGNVVRMGTVILRSVERR